MRRALTALLLLSDLLSGLPAQEPFLPLPPEEIETILQLLDAVDAAQITVLENPEQIGDAELAQLRELVKVAEVIGAEDLAARTRTLIVLASFDAGAPRQPLVAVDAPLSTADSAPMARNTDAFRRWVNVGATAGAAALGMSAVFYYLAERNYQLWVNEPPGDSADQLYRAWRGYDILGFSLGTSTLLSVGVALPLVFALTPPAATLATPPEATVFNAAERDAELERLHEERREIVAKLNRLNTREDRRSLMKTISLGVGAAGAITAGTFYYMADATYQRYLDAPTTAEAEPLGKRVSLLDAFAAIGAGLGGGGFGFAATLGVVTPDRRELERSLQQVNESIIRVRASRTIEIPPAPPEEESSRRPRRDDDGAEEETQ